MKKLVLVLYAFVLISLSLFAQKPSGVIYKTSMPPTIDGKIDEVWATSNQYNIDRKFQKEEPTLGEVGTTYWKALWDDKGMYVLVVVNDDQWFPYWKDNAFDSWMYDKVELYYDVNAKLNDGVGGQSFNGHWQIAPNPQEGKTDGTLLSESIGVSKVNYAFKVVDPKVNAEYFIPWECLTDKTGAKFDKTMAMGFDVTLIDRDPGDSGRRRAQWANEGAKDENWNNMDDAGTLTFQELVVIDAGKGKTFVSGETYELTTSTNFANPGTLSYSWSPAEGLSQTDIPNPIMTATKDITYNVSVTNSDGQIGKAAVFIKVNPFVAKANDQSFSCGNEVQLDVSTNYTGTGTLVYDWQPKEFLNHSDIQNPIASVTKPTDFTVTVTTPQGVSAQKTVHVDVTKTNFQAQLCMVSVDKNNKNVLVWQQQDETAIQDYLIFRESLIQTDFYDLIGSLSSSSDYVFTDLASNALVQSNKYKIAARDLCGFVTNQSAPHKTMHLSINKGQGNSWNLIWEPYDGFKVSSYKIFRGTTSDNLTQIGSTAGSANSYSDLTAGEGDVYYQVEVMAPSPCNALKSTAFTSTRSNMASSIYNSVSAELNNYELDIFPNPVNDKLFINREMSCISELLVLSIDGRIELSFKQPFMDESIDVSHLANGIYLLKIADRGGISVQKFIKE